MCEISLTSTSAADLTNITLLTWIYYGWRNLKNCCHGSRDTAPSLLTDVCPVKKDDAEWFDHGCWQSDDDDDEDDDDVSVWHSDLKYKTMWASHLRWNILLNKLFIVHVNEKSNRQLKITWYKNTHHTFSCQRKILHIENTQNQWIQYKYNKTIVYTENWVCSWKQILIQRLFIRSDVIMSFSLYIYRNVDFRTMCLL